MVTAMIKFLAGVIAAFSICIAGPVQAQAAWDHVARVVVIGDLHGDYG